MKHRPYTPDKRGVAPFTQPSPSTASKPPKLPPFDVVALTPVNAGTLLAFVDVRIGRGPNEVTVCKWRLIQQPGQIPWVSPPQEIWTDDAGQRKYKNLFVYPKEWREPLTAVVVEAWRKAQEGGAR